MINKIDLTLYEKFRDLSFRYFELYLKDEKKSLIFSANINIILGVQDINHWIDKYNKESRVSESSRYYELMVKAYQILNAFDVIVKKFQVIKSGYDQLYEPEKDDDGLIRKEERQKIDYFRALRSLTTAHTLKTTESTFKKFDINKDTYLEDVRIRESYRFLPPNVEGDIILEIRKKDENINNGLGELNHRGVCIDGDIIEPIRIIISKFDMVNKKNEKLIIKKEYELKCEKIGSLKVINKKFIIDLEKAVKKRYPKEIEVVNYDGEEVTNWAIQEIFDFVSWQQIFRDERGQKLKRLQDIKRVTLMEYAEKVQSMTLNNENLTLSTGISTKGIKYYNHSKISAYLRWNKGYPKIKEIECWKDKLDVASNLNQVKDEVWGALLLKEIQPELDKYFIIDWDTSYRELYWQYLVALFIREQDWID